MNNRDRYSVKPSNKFGYCWCCDRHVPVSGLVHNAPIPFLPPVDDAGNVVAGSYCAGCCSDPDCKVTHGDALRWEAEDRQEWKDYHSGLDAACEDAWENRHASRYA
jgi:hypothetical protein